MALRSVHLFGAFLLFVATVLLIITDITAPAVSNLAIFRIDNNQGQPPSSVYYGTFGYCTSSGGVSVCYLAALPLSERQC